MTRYADFHRRSLEDRAGFWAEQAQLIDWHRPVRPRVRLRQPAVREVVRRRPDQPVPQRDRPAPRCPRGSERADLGLDRDGRGKGLQLPRAARRSAAHGGVPARARREAGRPRADLHADDRAGGVRDARLCAHRCDPFGCVRRLREWQPGEPHRRRAADRDRQRRCRQPLGQGDRAYKPLLDEAIRLATHKPAKVLLVDRGLAPMVRVPGRDEDYAALREQHLETVVPCVWLDATAPSYTLYTSGTTGKPKGRAARHRRLRGGARGEHEAHLQCELPATPTSAPATSAGSSATATSSTAR